MRSSSWAVGVLAVATAVGCSVGEAGTSQGSQSLISDALHSGGTQGFFFLPPVVPRPAPVGDVVGDADPVVRIDQIDPNANGAVVRTVATFTRTAGPVGERVRLKLRGEPCAPDDDDGDTDPEGYYVARWHTRDNPSLTADGVYRIRVLVHGGALELGFADVDIVRNTREYRQVDRTEYVPLLRDRTLRIKFRIDRPAVDRDGDGALDWADNCPNAANATQADADGDGRGDACDSGEGGSGGVGGGDDQV